MHIKQAALDLTPTETYSALASAKTAKPPEKFTYALPAFTVQRRKTGWWFSPSKSATPEEGSASRRYRYPTPST